ncbi:MAG: ArsR/SmtB family transcription factor [Burkholderiaceae bacterium]
MTRPASASGDGAIDRTLQALAEPTRRAVVGLLRDGPRRAGDIAAALAMSRQAMSRHLRVLRQAGVILESGAAHPDDDARARTYQLQAAPLAELQGWLGDMQAFWCAQMAAFKAHAERVARERGAQGRAAARPAAAPAGPRRRAAAARGRR